MSSICNAFGKPQEGFRQFREFNKFECTSRSRRQFASVTLHWGVQREVTKSFAHCRARQGLMSANHLAVDICGCRTGVSAGRSVCRSTGLPLSLSDCLSRSGWVGRAERSPWVVGPPDSLPPSRPASSPAEGRSWHPFYLHSRYQARPPLSDRAWHVVARRVV